jgi:hypothetical protein
MLALGSLLSAVSPIEKTGKLERALVPFSFVSGEQEEIAISTIHFIPKMIQNFKLINLGLTFLKTLMIKCSKGKKGVLGGNSSLVTEAYLGQNPGYETVILMSIHQTHVKSKIDELLEDHEPILKSGAVGIAKWEGDQMTDCKLLYSGIYLAFNLM